MRIKMPILVLLVKNVEKGWFSWTSTSGLKLPYLTTRMSKELLSAAIISRSHVSSLFSVQCHYNLMRVGTKSFSTLKTIARRPLAANLWSARRSKSMRTAALLEYTSMIRSKAKTKSQQTTNSSWGCNLSNADYLQSILILFQSSLVFKTTLKKTCLMNFYNIFNINVTAILRAFRVSFQRRDEKPQYSHYELLENGSYVQRLFNLNLWVYPTGNNSEQNRKVALHHQEIAGLAQ